MFSSFSIFIPSFVIIEWTNYFYKHSKLKINVNTIDFVKCFKKSPVIIFKMLTSIIIIDYIILVNMSK